MPESARKRLDSWKEIAAYLGRDVTTVMRWEREKALPVHRLPGGRRKAVFAYQDEIEAWYAGGENKEVPAEAPPPEPVAVPIIDSPSAPSKRWRRGIVILVPALAVLLGLGALTAPRFRPVPQLRLSSYLPPDQR
jgi:hypothetical protein